MPMRPRTRRSLVFFATALGIILLWNTPILYPLRVFVVLLHELSHGLAAVLTGGAIERIVLTPDEGGETLTRGGNAFLTLSAGYLGSLGWGVLILSTARFRKAGHVLAFLGLAVLALTALYVRSAFGLAFGVLFGLAALLGGRRLPHRAVGWLLLVVGLTSCMYAVLDIKSDVLDRPDLPSDARILSQLTHVPVLAWGVLWLGISLAVAWWVFRRSVSRG